ncbi:MAG: histidine kinase [Bryobacteraceae bacterium]|nr:histidine kinase [Bryobacteraceae bacterium]MDW8377051.1 histidine kinase [Bryobacterales bacterium]
MRSKITAALLAGFSCLLVLIGLLGFGAMHRADQMHQQMVAAQLAYEEVDEAIRDLPADLHLAGILVRDYVLDPSPTAAPEYKAQLATVQQSIERHLKRLSRLQTNQKEKVERLQKETQEYADSLDPMLNWSPEEKLARSHAFIRQNLLPKRQSIVALANELRTLNAHNLAVEREARERGQQSLRSFIIRLLWTCLGLGAVVTLLALWRVTRLERKMQAERERAEEAEREQRRLARKVVEAQEEERKRISLELHDAVGQMASALGMELGWLEAAQHDSPERFQEKLAEVKRLNTEVVRAIKDLAAGLRPAMLDDLGLGPALRWHARECSRRTGIPVDVRLDGNIAGVPEPHRTCVYRIVQEALNNCARHAQAKQVIVSLYGREDMVSVTVQDDGVGFNPAQLSKSGLGLIGIQERVRDLGGVVKITSRPGAGTLLELELPIREMAHS